MFSKNIFILAHKIECSSFPQDYQIVVKNQWKDIKNLKEEQDFQLRRMMSFCYENVPYYHKLFRTLKLQPCNIRTQKDLEKLPILTKETIKQNWEDFKPINLTNMKFNEQSTGGSTGTPLKYRMSKHDRFLGGALLYRGWGYGGYELGDRMIFLAGSSLFVDTKIKLNKYLHEKVRNIKKLSSFEMGEEKMRKYAQLINSYNPKFIRGYASSIYFFSKWIEGTNLRIRSPLAVFTTSEKLYPYMRNTISKAFDCDVFDGYGLNDGGVSAFECSEHNGLHIDTERGIMEVVDDRAESMESGRGQILATSLHNYAMPFIRYATGDEGHIVEDRCGCGRKHSLLQEIIGRSTDVLVTPEGENIHGWFFLAIFWKYCEGIREYQVVQETVERIVIRIIPEENFNVEQIDLIRKVIKEKCATWTVKFVLVESIDRTVAGKYKFIINNLIN